MATPSSSISRPIQTLMAIGLTQPRSRSTSVRMTGGADLDCAAAPMPGQQPVIAMALNHHQFIAALHHPLHQHSQEQRQQGQTPPLRQIGQQPGNQSNSQQGHNPGLGDDR